MNHCFSVKTQGVDEGERDGDRGWKGGEDACYILMDIPPYPQF